MPVAQLLLHSVLSFVHLQGSRACGVALSSTAVAAMHGQMAGRQRPGEDDSWVTHGLALVFASTEPFVELLVWSQRRPSQAVQSSKVQGPVR